MEERFSRKKHDILKSDLLGIEKEKMLEMCFNENCEIGKMHNN